MFYFENRIINLEYHDPFLYVRAHVTTSLPHGTQCVEPPIGTVQSSTPCWSIWSLLHTGHVKLGKDVVAGEDADCRLVLIVATAAEIEVYVNSWSLHFAKIEGRRSDDPVWHSLSGCRCGSDG